MPATEISLNDLINSLMDTNTDLLGREIGLTEKMESDLLGLSSDAQLQGEVEEILRQILQIAQNSIETVLTLQEQLQTRIVESFFPAQD